VRGFDWNHLHYFRLVGRLQHVTRAAEQLGISQPALSRALAQLNDQVGVPLFQRSGRSIRLTRYGEKFLHHVERASREIDQGRLELDDMARPEKGTVALGFLRTLGAEFVPRMVRGFTADYPQVQFEFTQGNSVSLATQIDHGELDLIFTVAPKNDAAFSWTRIADQELRLFVPLSHPLARRRSVTLNQVAHESFVSFKPGHEMRRLTDELCQAAGFSPRYSFEGDESGSVPGFVAAGFGVAIMPAESNTNPEVVGLRIAKPAASRPVGIGWIEDRFLSASARAFRDFAVATGWPRRATG
jgi:DNA-binding transcriptional LysR family regulator